MNPILVKNFDVTRVGIGIAGSRITLDYAGKDFLLQTPDLRITARAAGDIVVDLADQDAFFEALLALDNKVLQTCVERSAEIFGARVTRDQLYPCFKPLIRMSDGATSAKIKIPAAPAANVFDVRRRRFHGPIEDALTVGTVAKFIVAIRNVWILPEEVLFGTSMRLVQAGVTRPGEPPDGRFAFLRDED
jgi:hypothetical protein